MGSSSNLKYPLEVKPHLPPLCFRNEVYQSVTSLESFNSDFTPHPLGTESTPLQDSQHCLITSASPSSASLLPQDYCHGHQGKSRRPTKSTFRKKEKGQPSSLNGFHKKNHELLHLANLSKQHDGYGSVAVVCKDDILNDYYNKRKTTENVCNGRNGKHKPVEIDSKKNLGPRLQYLKRLRMHTYGCVISLAISMMCLYSCFLSLKSLQSTVHDSWKGIGVTSLSCIYAAGVIACIVAPLIIEIFGHKFTMTSSMLLFLVYIGCNMLPEEHLYFLIPASMLLGCSLGLLWTSACSFLTSSVNFYSSAIKSSRPEELLCKFNGIFYTIFSTAHFWAHLVSGTVLNAAGKSLSQKPMGSLSTPPIPHREADTNSSTSEGVHNATRTSDSLAPIRTTQSLKCGGHFEAKTPLFKEQTQLYYNNSPSDTQGSLANHVVAYKAWFLLCLVYIILVVISVIIVLLFLRKRPETPAHSPDDSKQTGNHDSTDKDEVKSSSGNQSNPMATLVLFKDPRVQLLVPLIVFTALKESFVYSDYTKFYISCSMGVTSIGMVMITYGVLFTTGSLFIGLVVKHIKSYLILVAGALFETGNLMVLLWWRPHVGDVEIFYVIAASMGVCDAIWKTQMNVTLGVLFYDKLESAFALHRLVTFLGLSLSFACSHFLFLRTKIYLMGVLLVIGLGMYAVVHLKSTGTMKSADRLALRLVPLVSV